MPRGRLPAAISPTTRSAAVSIMLTVPDFSFATYANGPACASAAAARSSAPASLRSRVEVELVLLGGRKLEVHASCFAQRRHEVVERAAQFLRPIFQRPVFGCRIHGLH